jgi:HPt (histidine-containing phosphotransfer) domain-containing protein
MKDVKIASQTQKIDMAELLTRVDNDLELLRDLVAIFQEDFPRHLDTLRGAVAANDLREVKVASHTLKGMLANLAVSRAATAAAQLEQVAAAGSTESVGSALAEFEREVDGLLVEMQVRAEEAQL